LKSATERCCTRLKVTVSSKHGRMQKSTDKTAAFFDFDGTMITGSSGMLWAKRERRLGRLGRRYVALAMLYMVLYRFRIIDMVRATENAIATIKSRTESEIVQESGLFYENDVQPLTAKGTRPVVEAHRQSGDRLVLLSSISKYESKLVVEDFDLDDYLCTLYEVKDDRFTGGVIEPVCYGEGKVILAERYAEKHGIDLDKSYFYTDSCTDLPMLERVGHPRAVMPDSKLRRVARKRGWPILDWR
jgi:HAD superfamily hydrolase (TIGR01490 family)